MGYSLCVMVGFDQCDSGMFKFGTFLIAEWKKKE